MDDLMCKFNELILQSLAVEGRLKEEFQKSTQKLDEHVAQSIATGTPVQNKKRPKRLNSTDDGGHGRENESSNNCSSASLFSRSSGQIKDSDHDLPQEKNKSLAEAIAVPAPVDASTFKSASRETAPVHEAKKEELGRPARSAKNKATNNLKEPTLNSKMRRPDVTIKQERISLEAKKERAEPMELDVENNANLINGVAPLENDEETEKRRSNDEGFGSTNEKEREAEDIPAREMSIVVIPQPIPKVEVLSDDDDTGKMPPPSMPPPSMPASKARGRPKKVKKSEAFPVPIKREKDCDETSTSAVSSSESIDSSSSKKPSSRNKKKKDSTQTEVEKVRIKQEKLSNEGKEKSKKSKAVEKPAATSPAQSEKSVYEDALDGDTIMRPLTVNVCKLPVGAEPEKNKTFALDKNGTFSAQASDGTFVIPSPSGVANGTFNVKSPENTANATFDVRQLPGTDNTFVMDNKKPSEEQRALINASIMTEDNSYSEETAEKRPALPAKKPSVAKKPQPPPAKTTSKKHNELFSLQSPIKSRIEAFEKATIGSPMHTRAANTAKNTTPSQTVRLPPKTSTTPLGSQRFPASTKSAVQTTPTAQSNLTQAKGISSSASKLAHLQKKPATALPKSQSLSREPSVERLGTLSAASSSSSLAMDERKKKREEKQRLAQQQREQLEKEKRLHAEKLMREKEEKHRKLVQEKEEKLRADLVKKAKKMEEFEKRRHLEELNQRLLAEQKRDELAKLEQHQRVERDADIFKMNQAKENYEIKLHKQIYQQKMQQQQKIQQAQLLQQQQLQLKKMKHNAEKSDKVYFNFDMIETDDSTDDESTSSSKKTKRPPLPPWCSKEERRQPIRIQGEIKLKVIDQFFSVTPMTPDLREIFPTIDSRKLKRNSSAVWRTPPRYSQMPKY